MLSVHKRMCVPLCVCVWWGFRAEAIGLSLCLGKEAYVPHALPPLPILCLPAGAQVSWTDPVRWDMVGGGPARSRNPSFPSLTLDPSLI